jgi:2-dehydro-3-deoxyphosphogluconate aldolase/(4S)-4-hydroxy-2-oxoglutarate aldolase
MSQKILEKIKSEKIIAIIRGVSSEHIIPTVEALVNGGIHCVEITFNPSSEEKSKDTLVSIKKVSEHFKDTVFVGAGTVMTVKQTEDAIAAGAEYIISPNVNEAVIRRTKELGKISMPGAFTPTEAGNAYDYGCDIVKMFPAGILGPGYIKAVTSSMSHLTIAAVGGIDVDNIDDFIKVGTTCFGIGSNLVNTKLVEKGDFATITETAKKFCQAVSEI